MHTLAHNHKVHTQPQLHTTFTFILVPIPIHYLKPHIINHIHPKHIRTYFNIHTNTNSFSNTHTCTHKCTHTSTQDHTHTQICDPLLPTLTTKLNQTPQIHLLCDYFSCQPSRTYEKERALALSYSHQPLKQQCDTILIPDGVNKH